MFSVMNGLLMIILTIAAAAIFLSSASVGVEAFSATANNNIINNNDNNIDIGSQVSIIHSHIQSSRSALLSGLRSLSSFHPQAETAGDEENGALIYIPKSCFSNPMTVKSVGECVTEFKMGYYPTGCQSNGFNINQCKVNLPGAIRGLLPRRGPQANATIACFDAINAFTANVTNKCGAVITQVTATTTNTNINAILDAQCDIVSGQTFADCKTAFKSPAAVQAACPSYPLGVILQASSAVTEVIEGPLSALCIRDELDASKSCLSGVLSTFTSFKEKLNLTSVSDLVLNAMCKSCMLTILDKIASVGNVLKGPLVALNAAITAIQVLCTKDPTDSSKYCVKVFGNAAALAIKTKTLAPSNDEFSLLCNPCLNAMLMKAATNDLFAPALIPLKALSVICVKDKATNAYCGATMFNEAKTVVSALSQCTVGCTSACKAAVAQVRTDQCCFASVGFSAFIPLASDFLDKSSLARLTAAASCASDITKGCSPPPIFRITKFIELPNIDASIIKAKAAVSNAVRAALIKDLSFALAIDASDFYSVSLSDTPAANGGTRVTIEFHVEASLKDAYLNNFNQLLNKVGGLPLANTAQAAQSNQATIVNGEPVYAANEGANNPGGNPDGGDTSAAIHHHASIIVMAALTIAFHAIF